MSFLVRPMVEADLKYVVAVHNTAFAGFFLDRMGPLFLRRYYESVLSYSGSIALVSVSPDTNEVIGFAVGFYNSGKFYEHFRAQRKKMVFALVIGFLRRPSLFVEMVRNTKRVSASVTSQENTVELSSIATATRGTGVGRVLLSEFERAARALSAERIQLTTDEMNNDGVRAFYERNEFVLNGKEQRGARTLCVYVKHLA